MNIILNTKIMQNINQILAFGSLSFLLAFSLPCSVQSQTKLYVGNITYGTTENEVKEAFSGSGAVKSVQLINDRETGKFRGFGFVTMGTPEEATKAIKDKNGSYLNGKPLKVNLALSTSPKLGNDSSEGRGGYGGGRGGYDGNGRNNSSGDGDEDGQVAVGQLKRARNRY